MERLTHKRENGIKRGYWSPNKKQELVDRLAMYEDREESADFGKWIPCSERLPKDTVLFSLEQLKSLFGDDYVAPRLSIKTYNGDDVAQEVHFYAPEIWRGGIFQYFYPTNREGKMRVNYRLEYVYGDNS